MSRFFSVRATKQSIFPTIPETKNLVLALLATISHSLLIQNSWTIYQKLDLQVLYIFHLDHTFIFFQFPQEIITSTKSVQKGVLYTKQAITRVTNIQMSWTLYGIKLDSKWRNFHIQHFSRNSLHHSQKRARTQVKISVSKSYPQKPTFYKTRIYTSISPRKIILFPWNFYCRKLIKSLTFL